MLTVVEVIPYRTHKERLKLLKMNSKKKCKLFDGYITIEKQVEDGYDDRL